MRLYLNGTFIEFNEFHKFIGSEISLTHESGLI